MTPIAPIKNSFIQMEASKSIISDKFSFGDEGGDFIGFYVDNILKWFKSPVDKYTFLYVLWMNTRKLRETETAKNHFKNSLLSVRDSLFDLHPFKEPKFLHHGDKAWEYSEKTSMMRRTKLTINKIMSMKHCCHCGNSRTNIFICREREMPFCHSCARIFWKKKKYKCKCKGDILARFTYHENVLFGGSRTSYLYLKCGLKKICHPNYDDCPHTPPCETKLQCCDFNYVVTTKYKDNSSKKAKMKRKRKRYRDQWESLDANGQIMCICM